MLVSKSWLLVSFFLLLSCGAPEDEESTDALTAATEYHCDLPSGKFAVDDDSTCIDYQILLDSSEEAKKSCQDSQGTWNENSLCKKAPSTRGCKEQQGNDTKITWYVGSLFTEGWWNSGSPKTNETTYKEACQGTWELY